MSFFIPSLKKQQSVINSKLNLAQVLRELPLYPSAPDRTQISLTDVVRLPKLNAVNRVKKYREYRCKQEAPLPCQVNTDVALYNAESPKYEGSLF